MAAKFGVFVDEDHSKLPTLNWLCPYSTYTKNLLNHQESINIRIRLWLVRIINFSTHSVMIYDSVTKEGRNSYEHFRVFGWIRPASPRYCDEFTTMCNNILRHTAIS